MSLCSGFGHWPLHREAALRFRTEGRKSVEHSRTTPGSALVCSKLNLLQPSQAVSLISSDPAQFGASRDPRHPQPAVWHLGGQGPSWQGTVPHADEERADSKRPWVQIPAPQVPSLWCWAGRSPLQRLPSLVWSGDSGSSPGGH